MSRSFKSAFNSCVAAALLAPWADGASVHAAYVVGNIYTVAGTGVRGFSGDNGPAVLAQLRNTTGVAVDAAGNLYIVDGNQRVRKVAVDGTITTIAGTGIAGYSGDNGPAAAAQLNNPFEVAVDDFGNVYIGDQTNSRVRKITPGGIITSVAGNGTQGYSGDNDQATAARLTLPQGVRLDSAGNLYISGHSTVRKVGANGVITTVAGTGAQGYSGDNGSATSAQLNNPAASALDSTGNLYIADNWNHRVRKVATSGIITTVAGTGVAGYSGDNGPATAAQLNYPVDLIVDRFDNIYIADQANHRIRKLTKDGRITTVAGTGTADYAGDGNAARTSRLNGPSGLAFDAAGNLYIADQGNSAVRMVAGMASPVVSDPSCLFAWAENSFATLLAPPAPSYISGSYYYRFYSVSNSYVIMSSSDKHLYYIGGGGVADLGYVSTWYGTAGCP